jgi:hypothetical protein
MRQDQEYRTDDAQRSSFRTALARALWEICRRCDDGFLEAGLKGDIAAKSFALRYSDEKEVSTAWEPLWGELCPTNAGGVERYYVQISAELRECFSASISRAEKVNMAKAVSALATQLEKKMPRPVWSSDQAVTSLHAKLLKPFSRCQSSMATDLWCALSRTCLPCCTGENVENQHKRQSTSQLSGCRCFLAFVGRVH